MNVAILSLSKNVESLLNILNVTHFIVESCDQWGTWHQGREVISIGRAVKLYRQGILDKFLIPSMEKNNNERMYSMLCGLDVPDRDILYADRVAIHGMDKKGDLPVYRERKELDALEFHVTDECNLKCKHCCMFSGLVKESVLPDAKRYLGDLKQLHGLFRSIKRVKLLGGEPLLNPNLCEFVKYTRQVYPLTDIIIVTNGILVRSMHDDLVDAIRDTNTEILVSHYKIYGEYVEKIHEYLSMRGIRHRFTPCLTEFSKIYDLLGRQDAAENFRVCNCRGETATLRDGRLAMCYVPGVIGFAVREFQMDITSDEIVKDSIDIYEPGLSAEAIRERFQIPLGTCRFCLPRGAHTQWELIDKGAPRKLEDWSI